jgi:hypothetical protein
MSYITIKASKISEHLYKPSYSQTGKDRLERFYDYYQYLEGTPIVEQVSEHKYRLITFYVNYEIYNLKQASFLAQLQTFSNDTERFLEVLKQLFDGKANSSFNDRYIILKKLLTFLTLEKISGKINIPIKELKPFTFCDDRFKPYLEKSIEFGVRTTMEDVVRFLRRPSCIKDKTEAFLLNFVLYGSEDSYRLTGEKWKIVRTIIDAISNKFAHLHATNQCLLLSEIIKDGWTTLIDHFEKRCEQLLEDDRFSEE